MLDAKEEVNAFLLSRMLSPEDMMYPDELVRPLDSNIAKFAELLWILRPIIYGRSKTL
jgi:peroxin-16